METYQELKARHEKEVNALPLGFAFSEEQFEEMKLKLGVKENSELYRLGNTGGFYRKVDSELIHNTFKRHVEERRNAIFTKLESTCGTLPLHPYLRYSHRLRGFPEVTERNLSDAPEKKRSIRS